MRPTARRVFLLVAAAAVVAALAMAGLRWLGGGEAGAPPAAEPTIVTEPAPGEPVATDPEPVPAGASVDVVVTYWGWDDDLDAMGLGGFASGVVEATGTCRLTATRGNEFVSAEVTAQPDASTMACGEVRIERDDLTPGTWSAVLSYESPTATGAAAAVDVEVPEP